MSLKNQQNWYISSHTYQPKKKAQITNIRNKRHLIITDSTDVELIIKKYYKQPYAPKFDNLDEMHQFLEID